MKIFSCTGLLITGILSCLGVQAQNVILFVGDGMGISTITAARIYAGQQAGQPGEEYSLAFEHFPNLALVKTYNFDAQVPDSAGTISAMLTGQKTRMGVLGVNHSVARGDCERALKHELPTLFELAEEGGFATGVVTNTRITHATPAGAYAHTPDRDWEDNTLVPQAALTLGCRDIARQLIEFGHGDGLDVILGGGRSNFFPVGVKDAEHPDKAGRRTDGRNLVEEWLADGGDRHYVWNQQQFAEFTPGKNKQLMGLFEPSHLNFEVDRGKDVAGEPSLAEMTGLAISQLQQRGQPFLLLVEGGRIDHAHHFGNAYRALTDTVALSAAVAQALSQVDSAQTLIIVTADHSHTLTISGYPQRGNPILGKVKGPGPVPGMENPPYTTLGYANGPGYKDRYPDLRQVDTTAPDYRQIAAVPLQIETHAGEDVAAFATGPGAHGVRGVMEQNALFDVMRRVLFDTQDHP